MTADNKQSQTTSVLSQSQTTGFPCVTVELPLHLGEE